MPVMATEMKKREIYSQNFTCINNVSIPDFHFVWQGSRFQDLEYTVISEKKKKNRNIMHKCRTYIAVFTWNLWHIYIFTSSVTVTSVSPQGTSDNNVSFLENVTWQWWMAILSVFQCIFLDLLHYRGYLLINIMPKRIKYLILKNSFSRIHLRLKKWSNNWHNVLWFKYKSFE